MYSALHRLAVGLARIMAIVGGTVLIGIVLLTCASILGRALLPLDVGLGPIKGIYDITEIGVAAAVFAFLPWCQINGAHATVDLFKPVFPGLMNRVIDVLVDVGLMLVAGVLAWRLYLGMLDKLRYNETTLIMQLPVWLGFLASLIGAVAFFLVALFCVVRSSRTLLGLGKEERDHVQL